MDLDLAKHVLLIGAKPDIEVDSIAEAWVSHNGEVLRLSKFWSPPHLTADEVHVYGSDNFCLILQQKLGLKLISPQDDFLLGLGDRWVKRDLSLVSLCELADLEFPLFAKTAVPKLFRSSVYGSYHELEQEARGLEPETQVIVSSLVKFKAEVRVFLLNNMVLDLAVYEGEANLSGALQLLDEFLRENDLPSACVLDLGLLEAGGWAIIEANAAWGAGLNGCAAHKVLPVIAAASSKA